MDIRRCGSVAARRPPADWFTGSVWQEPIAEVPEPGRLRANLVRFDPGARTNWHTHPLGQTLYVVAGSGLVQREGEPAVAIHAGDTVFIPVGVRHWHGAGPQTAMTHVAMQEAENGSAVTWEEPVADGDYASAAAEAAGSPANR